MRRSRRPAPALAILVFTFSTAALTVLLAACGGGTAPPPDTTAPSLTITSTTTATSATYHLTGKTKDNVGATKLTYTVDGGPAKTVDLSGGTFDITVTLQAGQNTIDVKVFDAAGNVKDVVFHVTYTPPPSDGLTVTISGLPSGTDADVTVTGPGGTQQAVTATRTITGLADGIYTVTAASVSAGGTTYDPTPASQTVDLSGNQTGSASVTYAARTVAPASITLTVDASALPSGATPSISVTGPGGYAANVTSTTTLNGLAPGTYTVQAPDVTQTTTQDVYAATVTGSPASVPAGGSASVSVAYARSSDHLTVTIVNPSSANPNVHVTGPNGFDRPLTATTTLTGLADGTYTVHATSFTDSGGVTYVPDQSSQTVALSGGQDGSATVTYAQQAATTADLSIAVSGLQTGTPANVGLTGPGGYTKTVTASTTLHGLAPGTYDFTVHPVSDSDYDYTGSAQASITLAAGDSPTVPVTYTATQGALDLTVSGLPTGTTIPGGSNAPIRLAPSPSGSPGTTYTITAGGTLGHLAPGQYAFVLGTITGSDAELYQDVTDTSSSLTITITAGATTSKTLAFTQVSGDLQVTINGPASGNVDVVQPGTNPPYSTNLTTTTTLKGLWASGTGTPYYVTVNDVQFGGYDWTGSASSTNPVVRRGQTQSVTIDYQATDGKLYLDVSGLPSGLASDVDLQDGSGAYWLQGEGGSTNVTMLPSGTYTVTVHSVQDTDYSYAFVPYHSSTYSFDVTVNDGQQTTASVTYGAVTGILDVTVTGITDGAMPDVTVASSSTSHPVTATGLTVLKYLGAGDYTTTANNVTGNLFHYTASPASQTVHVGQGQTTSESVGYIPTDGAMQITFSGPIPSTKQYGATITGPSSTSKTVSTSSANVPQTLAFLPQGSYTVTPADVNGPCPAGATVTRYRATVLPTSPSVTNGQTESVSVVYSTYSFTCPSVTP